MAMKDMLKTHQCLPANIYLSLMVSFSRRANLLGIMLSEHTDIL